MTETIEDIFSYNIIEESYNNRVIMHLIWDDKKAVKGIVYPKGDEDAKSNALELCKDILRHRHKDYIASMKSNEENFANFIASPENIDWTMRIRANQWNGIIDYNTNYEDLKSIDELSSIINKYEGDTLRIKLFSDNDEYGPIEEGRGNYRVINGKLCEDTEYRFEIRNCIGLAGYFNERQQA